MRVIDKGEYIEIDVNKNLTNEQLQNVLKIIEIYEMANEIDMPNEKFDELMNEVNKDIREYAKKWVDGN